MIPRRAPTFLVLRTDVASVGPSRWHSPKHTARIPRQNKPADHQNTNGHFLAGHHNCRKRNNNNNNNNNKNNNNKQKQEKCGCLPTENLGIIVTATIVQVSQKNKKVLQGRLLFRLGRILARICKPETCFAVFAVFVTEQL
jgi:hypothetical protein